MKYLGVFLFFLLLTLNCFSQVFEHWDDRYNQKNVAEMEKSQKFLESNNVKMLKVYNCDKGKVGYFIDKLPYVFDKNGDTLTYLIPGDIFPMEREEFLRDMFSKDETRPFFIDEIRHDGRISVRILRKYRFLVDNDKLFYIYQKSTLDSTEERRLYKKAFNASTESERDKIIKEFNKTLYYEKELIFDFKKQKTIGEKIKIDSNRFTQLLDIKVKNGKNYYKFKTNIKLFELVDTEFIVDRNGNFYLLERHEIKN